MILHYVLNIQTGQWILPSFHLLPDEVDTLVDNLNEGDKESKLDSPTWVHESANMEHPGFIQFRNAMAIRIEAAMMKYQNGDVVIAQNFVGQTQADKLAEERNEQTKRDIFLRKHLAESATMGNGAAVRAIAMEPRDRARLNSQIKEAGKTEADKLKLEEIQQKIIDTPSDQIAASLRTDNPVPVDLDNPTEPNQAAIETKGDQSQKSKYPTFKEHEKEHQDKDGNPIKSLEEIKAADDKLAQLMAKYKKPNQEKVDNDVKVDGEKVDNGTSGAEQSKQTSAT